MCGLATMIGGYDERRVLVTGENNRLSEHRVRYEPSTKALGPVGAWIQGPGIQGLTDL